MKDQLGRTVEIPASPCRIVTVVPSQTELLFDLGLRDEVLGITRFCVHPDLWFRSKIRVGGTKKLNIKRIESLQPDLIIANKEENTKEDILSLEKISPVWVSDIHNFEDAIEMIRSIGLIVHKESQAEDLLQSLIAARKNYEMHHRRRYSVLYLIWNDPYMAAGGDTFIHEMLSIAGFDNVCDKSRYPVVDIDTIRSMSPELILLSSEPFPFKQKHIDAIQSFLPKSKIILVDGELFSWYGSRMLKSFDYFSALHAQLQTI